MENEKKHTSPVLTEREAALYLRISLSKLQRLRKAKAGPDSSRIGRGIRYRKDDLDAFLEKHSTKGE